MAVTISEIAKLSGVSVATVSRVINNKGYVKEETRRQVEQVIREHGYRSGSGSRPVSSQGSAMIAVIMAERPFPFSSRILEAIEARAAEHGDSVLFYSTGRDCARELRAMEQAVEHQVKGILLLPVTDSGMEMEHRIREVERQGIPVVLINCNRYREDYDSVLIDNGQVIYDGARLLWERGHQKIGFITCPELVKGVMPRLDGFRKFLSDHQIPVKEEYIYDGEFEESSGYEACRALLGLEDPPTAILASCSSITLGCYRYLNENHRKLGEDVALVGFDDISLIGSLGYPVTTMEHSSWELGRSACDLMYMRVGEKSEDWLHRKLILSTRTNLRGSEGKICS